MQYLLEDQADTACQARRCAKSITASAIAEIGLLVASRFIGV
jgi:hypothetical protein